MTLLAMIKRLVFLMVLSVAGFNLQAEQCGELPCTYMLVPMRALGAALGFSANYDQVQVFVRTEDETVKAYLIHIHYYWQGQSAESDHVILRWPDGSGILTMFFLDIRDVQINSIEIRTLGLRKEDLTQTPRP